MTGMHNKFAWFHLVLFVLAITALGPVSGSGAEEEAQPDIRAINTQGTHLGSLEAYDGDEQQEDLLVQRDEDVLHRDVVQRSPRGKHNQAKRKRQRDLQLRGRAWGGQYVPDLNRNEINSRKGDVTDFSDSIEMEDRHSEGNMNQRNRARRRMMTGGGGRGGGDSFDSSSSSSSKSKVKRRGRSSSKSKSKGAGSEDTDFPTFDTDFPTEFPTFDLPLQTRFPTFSPNTKTSAPTPSVTTTAPTKRTSGKPTIPLVPTLSSAPSLSRAPSGQPSLSDKPSSMPSQRPSVTA